MSVQEHLRVLRQRWLTVVLAIIVATGLGVAYLALRPAAYTASLQMYVSSPAAGGSDSASLSGAQLAQDRVKSYQELVTSPRVLSGAIASARLPLTVAQLRDRVSATTTDESVVMVINVEDGSAADAAATANAVGDALTATVDNLERPSIPGLGAVAPVMTVRAVEPAPVPDAQSSASAKRVVGIAFLLGLAAGVGLALARHAADNSVRTSEQLAEIVGAPDLGNVALASSVGKRPLVVLEDPNSRAGEDFRRLRTNLQFIEADREHKVFMMCSALPAEGKTTTAINVALALSLAGHRVLLVDADLRRPTIAERLGLENDTGLTNVLTGAVGLFQAVKSLPSTRLDVLTSGTVPPNPSELLASAQNARTVEQARTRYDVVLIDTPPLLPVSDAAALGPLIDASLLICRATRTSSVEVRRAAQALRASATKIGGTVLVGGEKAARLSAYAYPRSYTPPPPSRSGGTETPGGLDNGHPSGPIPPVPSPAPRRRPRPHPLQPAQRAGSDGSNDVGTEQMARWNGRG